MATAEEKLQFELQSLQLIRATFESVRQLVDAVHKDVVTMTGNCEALVDINERWEGVISIPEKEEKKEILGGRRFGR